MGNEVGEVRGDQQAARKCYVETIQTGQKGAGHKGLLGRPDQAMEAIYKIQGGEPSPLSESEVEVIGIVPTHPEKIV